MLEISNKTNLLEQKSYKYSLQDVAEPNLQRDIYSYGTIPKVAFNHRRVPMSMPEEIWITDTSLRDGQQSVEPYSVDQIVNIYKLLSKLGGPYGIIRQTEFFIYSKKDRQAIEKCMELDLKFPEITSWIRASKQDFQLVKDLDLVSFVDYDSNLYDLYSNQMDCIVQPAEELGRSAGEQILNRVENPEAPVFEKVLTSAYRPYDTPGSWGEK